VKKILLPLLLVSSQALFGAGGHKLQVTDRAQDAQVIAAGGVPIGDYGSYRLYDVPLSVLTRKLGEPRDNYNFILLNAGRLDTSTSEVQAKRKSIGKFAGKRLHLVQFAGPVQPSWRQELLDAGVRIVSYIPQNAYLVYGDADKIARIQTLASTVSRYQWDGEYLNEYKIHPAARARKTDQFAIQLVADAQANAETLKLLDGLKLAQRNPPHRVLGFLNIIVRLRAADLDSIAARPDVISIQPLSPPKKLDERQDQIVAGNLSNNVPSAPGYLAWLAGMGFTEEQFTASGFVVNISDSGIDNGTTQPNHFGLYPGGNTNDVSRVVYSRLEGTSNSPSTLEGCDGHGTINAHIIAGFDDGTNFPFADSAGFAYGLGACPFARIGASVIFDPDVWTSPDLSQLESDAYNDGVRIDSNSWGDGDDNGSYGIFCQEYDALVRDAQLSNMANPSFGNREMVVVFAAGNSGPNPQTIDQPGTAKNVITVGGADNVQAFGGADGCGVGDNQASSANEIANPSSRGPCADGRAKPDLVAPATHISGGLVQAPDPGPLGTADVCFNGDSLCGGPVGLFYPPGQHFYTASSGTSHAAPCVAGGCALLRQYFINQSLVPPSPAMTKAWLMNSARYMTGATVNDTLPSPSQGMGELDLGASFDGVPRLLRDQQAADTFSASGQTRVFKGSIANTNIPFHVTLAWTDAPGNTAGASYNNDLDLTVTVGGEAYFGNVFNGNHSVPGGAADSVNNVESVYCPAGISGSFTITVTAANINSVGVPNAANKLLQDFALVVYNADADGPPVIVTAGAALTAENCPPGNGEIDPGETVTVNFALQNIGTVQTTNLVATLIESGGVVSPSGPINFGALPPGGIATSRPFTFIAVGNCGDTITATLLLQDGTNDLGTVSNIFTLGKFVAATNFSESFDAVAPPALPSGWTTDSLGGQLDWVTTNDMADTAPYSVFTKATTNAGVAELTSPVIALNSSAAQLIFRQAYKLEVNPFAILEALDGGVLEIQIGANAFADILAAGGSFVTNGYNKTIEPATSDDNPLANRAAWSGDSGGFITTIVNLPSAAIETNIVLRWRCATDTGNAYGSTGWWIDSVAVTDGGHYLCCDGILEPVIFDPKVQSANFSFSFQTASNQTYEVQYKNNLTDSLWLNLQTVPGDGQIHYFTNAATSSQGYYRLHLP
jgi:hypothetical protein